MTTLSAIMTRLKVINANVTSIDTTSKYPPVAVSTAQLPLMYSRYMESELNYADGQAQPTWHRFELVVLVDAIAQNTYTGHQDLLCTIAPSIWATYAGKVHLNDDDGNVLADIAVAYIRNVGNGPPQQIGDTYYSTIRAELLVKDQTEITIAG